MAQNPFLPEPTQQQGVEERNPFLPNAQLQTQAGYSGLGEVTLTDKLAFASQMGFSDTYRGIKQLFGVDEDEMAEEQKRLHSYLKDPENGGAVQAAYIAGLFGDPVGWVIPGMKAKNAYSAAKAGMIVGAGMGATGYVDEEIGITRVEQTLLGMTGGGVLSPALFKFQETLLPAMKTAYSDTLGKVSSSETMGKVKDVVQKGKDTKTGQTLGRWFVDNYGLPENYVKAKKNQRIDHEKYASKFTDTIKKHSELSPEEDALLYRILTGEESKVPSNLADLTKESRKLVDDMGQELVDLGILNKSVYKENKGKYLYRSYEKTVMPAVKKLVRDERKIKVFGSEFMRRGKTEKVPASELDIYLDSGYKQVGSINKKSHTVSVNRDWTKVEREEMGEVVSSAYGLAKTGKLMTNDVASFKFYDTISKDKDIVWAPATKYEQALGAPEGYVRISTDMVGGAPKYGNLAGKYVPENVYKDLNFADKFKAWKGTGLGKLQHNMQTWWKRTKTSLNPVVHMNNVMSNFVLYDLVDANYKFLGPAARELISKSGDFKKANSLGVFNADLMKQELTNLERDVFKTYLGKNAGEDAGGILTQAWGKTKSLGKYLKKTHLDDLYGAEDNIFRLGLFKDRIAKGDTEKEAAQFARKYMLDYEIHAPGVKMMRETGWPFISYIYRAAPIVAETAIKRPWKIAKWGLVLNAANQLGADVAEGDIEKERKLQEEANQGFKVLGMPGAHTMIKVPRTDKSQYLDVSRWVPAGDVLDTSSQGFEIPGVPAPLQPSGGALGGVYKTITGFSTFKGRKEPGVGSGVLKDELEGRAGLFFSEFFPGVHQYRKVKTSFSSDGAPHPSKDDYTKGEALLNAIGIKVKEFDTSKMTARVGYKYKNRIQSLKSKARQLTADYFGGRVDKEVYKKDIERLTNELNTISKEANEAIK